MFKVQLENQCDIFGKDMQTNFVPELLQWMLTLLTMLTQIVMMRDLFQPILFLSADPPKFINLLVDGFLILILSTREEIWLN